MRRALIPMLSVLAVFATTPAVRADDDPKQIIARAVKALGGEEYLAKNPAARIKNKGKLNIPGVGETDFTQEIAYMIPGRLRETMELSIAGQTIKISTIVNGKDISITAMDKEVPITDDIRKAMKDAEHMMSVARMTVLLKSKDYELSLFGEANVEEKPAVGVRVSAKDKKDITLFFDKKTDLLVKVEHRPTDAMTGNEVAEERIVAEYGKDKEGRPVPKKVIVKRDGKTFIEAECLELMFLEKIDDSEFKK